MISSLNDIPAIALYLKRIGARARSLKAAVVEENRGEYFRELAVIYFKESGEITIAEDLADSYGPTDSERIAILEACKDVQWPRPVLLKNITSYPDQLKDVDPEHIFEFRDINNMIIMLQARREIKGERSYVTYTYWTDDKWRAQEPGPELPLWGIPHLKEHSTVFIHEGAGAARYCDWMTRELTADAKKALVNCPWGDEMKGAAHVGWVGGALSPHRTEWTVINKNCKRAYIVADNDDAGRAAVTTISKALRIPTFLVQFTSEWPGSFDMKDEWPDKMFKTLEGKRFYTGPAFKDVVHPATWATDQKPNKKGKPTNVLRDNFKNMWAYIEEVDIFVCTEMPEIMRSEKVLNNMLSAFSHAGETSRLMLKEFNGRAPKLCYRPDVKGRVVTNKNTSAINLHVPTRVKAIAGDVTPFLDFMDYMFPKEDERLEMLRWCFTLIAHPEIRMEYGVLLVSESQGIGKTTLGSAILAPLVGLNNVSFPGESDIVNTEFNGWVAHKRLAVVNEIYSGHSWKAYNQLKTIITDKDVRMNEKFQKAYNIENWCHILACSNSLRALKVEGDDRRWLYPEVTEKRWSREKFAAFHGWLNSGGLSIIRHWAMQQKGWVMPGERAPMTSRKQDLIEGSMTEAQKEVSDLAVAMDNFELPIAVTMKDVMNWVEQSVHGKVHDTDYELRKAMVEGKAIVYKGGRIFIGGRKQYVMINASLADLIARLPDAKGEKELLTKHIKKANEILSTVM